MAIMRGYVASVTTTETFTYDAMGRMDTANKVEGATQISKSDFEYHDTGHLKSENQFLYDDTIGKKASYTYDPAGFRTSTAYPDDVTTITRTNTPSGKIDTLLKDGTPLVEYKYLGSRVFERRYPEPSITVSYGYDNFGRINDIDAGSGYIHFSYDYVDKENNIEKKNFHHRGVNVYNTYSYDDIDRLTGVTYHDSDTEGFKMDDLGNRSGNQTLRDDGTVNFAVDTLTNRYTAVGGSSLAYDDAGNLATDKDGYAYIYDYENRIVKIKDDQQTPIAEFAYDTQGRRIQKKVYEVGQLSYTSDYYYSDQWQVLTEVRIWPGYDPAVCTFVYGNYIDEVLQHTWTTPGGTSRRYLLHDHLYSPVVLMSDAGAIWQRYEYDAYGRRSAFTAAFAPSTLDYGNDIAFTGRELDILDDGGLKLMHYRHRAYDTYAGRFLQRDPLGINPAGGLNNLFDAQKQYSDGMNLYQYAGINSINNRDPHGLWCVGMANPFQPGFTVFAAPFAVFPVGGGVKLMLEQRYYFCSKRPMCRICDTVQLSGLFGVGYGLSVDLLSISLSFNPNEPISGYSTCIGAEGGYCLPGEPGGIVIGAEINIDSKEVTLNIPKYTWGFAAYVVYKVSGNCTGCSACCDSGGPLKRLRAIERCLLNVENNIRESLAKLSGTYQKDELPKTVTYEIPPVSEYELPPE